MHEHIPPHVYAQVAADNAASSAKANASALEMLVRLLEAKDLITPDEAAQVIARIPGSGALYR